MLRWGGRTPEGKRILGLILSRENVARALAGQPIYVDGASVGAEGVDVIIHMTDTPNEDLEALIRSQEGEGVTIRSLEEALGERQAIRKAGGDPDEEPTH